MIFGLDWPVFGMAFGFVLLGAAAQGAVGVGFGLIVAPVLALIDVTLVPAVVLLVGLLSAGLGAWHSRHGIVRADLVVPIVARIPGIFTGVFLLVWLAAHQNAVLIVTGGVVLLAVGITATRPKLRPTPGSLAATGYLSGVMGALTGIGGPPMTLIYQNSKALEVRAMLNLFFAVGTLFSLFVLGYAGLIGVRHLALSALLLPAVFAGMAMTGLVIRYMDRHIRATLLAVSALASVLLIGRGIEGLL